MSSQMRGIEPHEGHMEHNFFLFQICKAISSDPTNVMSSQMQVYSVGSPTIIYTETHCSKNGKL